MKKTKLLTPIIGVAAIGSVVAPIVTLSSCAEQTKQFIIEEKVIKQPERVMLDGTSGETKIKGFKLDNKRSGFGLKVEIVNQSFSSADLTATVEIAEDEVTFDVIINADIITTRQAITFDLKFTNARGHAFTSTGYKLDFTPIDWGEDIIAYGEKDGHKYFFNDESNFCSNWDPITSIDGAKWDRNIFDMEIWTSPHLEAINNSFLAGCAKFNSPIHFAEGLKSIGSLFMNYCQTFNQPLLFPESLTFINTNFLRTCYSFSSPITIGPNIVKLSSSFLDTCQKFNSTITIDCKSLEKLDLAYWLDGCVYKGCTVRFTNSNFVDKEKLEVLTPFQAFCGYVSFCDFDDAGECTFIVDNQEEADALEEYLLTWIVDTGPAPLYGEFLYDGSKCYRKIIIQVAE